MKQNRAFLQRAAIAWQVVKVRLNIQDRLRDRRANYRFSHHGPRMM